MSVLIVFNMPQCQKFFRKLQMGLRQYTVIQNCDAMVRFNILVNIYNFPAENLYASQNKKYQTKTKIGNLFQHLK